mmetsp:Transcript_15450/g.18628  ORF Transcript_15450/g.18628 Transcript_15450/m.18628 type:complete len:80 (-) Transcript_15450:369-608(-)
MPHAMIAFTVLPPQEGKRRYQATATPAVANNGVPSPTADPTRAARTGNGGILLTAAFAVAAAPVVAEVEVNATCDWEVK